MPAASAAAPLLVDGQLPSLPANTTQLDQQLLTNLLQSTDLLDSPEHKHYKPLTSTTDFTLQIQEQPSPSVQRYRGKTLQPIPLDVKRLAALLRTTETIQSLLPEGFSVEKIRTLDDTHQILLLKANVPLIANREFIVLQSFFQAPKGAFATSLQSIHLPEYEKSDSSLVRGKIIESGYVIEPLLSDSTKTILHFVMQIDLAGWLPHSAVDWLVVKSLPRLIEQQQRKEKSAATEPVDDRGALSQQSQKSHVQFNAVTVKKQQIEAEITHCQQLLAGIVTQDTESIREVLQRLSVIKGHVEQISPH